ncbi:hypothetical protein F5J12DRAFT_783510 [Pisolithus orientalis]|uniref:uncharacterized protein n=1 Tax=Pisolithus orientalis TaxID=936130 RepID=UPI00222572A8|nr:uncharacterized protein F5J12DRAFT_783510 [Pisolithus orientalis]KAI6003437.1 hypothetical protein F5J12DRAFT_783510 [Pisolithus orientalis]
MPATPEQMLEKTAAHVPEHVMALQATLEQILEQMPEKTVAHVGTLEHAMALWACQPLWSKFQSKLWHMCWSMPWPSGISCSMPATLAKIPEHTVAHVPEHTIAFQSTPEQAMALWVNCSMPATPEQMLEQTVAHVPEHAMALQDKLWHASHSRENSTAHCSTCAGEYHHILEHSRAGHGPPG